MLKAEEKLQQIINESLLNFNSISKEIWNLKPSLTKWSKKEILGHLCDSAMNNMRRFVVSQYEENNKIIYRQDEWVALQNYQHADYTDVITLWKLLNEQVIRVIETLPADKLQNTCITEAEHPLQWLIEDYIKHLNHHLSQILN